MMLRESGAGRLHAGGRHQQFAKLQAVQALSVVFGEDSRFAAPQLLPEARRGRKFASLAQPLRGVSRRSARSKEFYMDFHCIYRSDRIGQIQNKGRFLLCNTLYKNVRPFYVGNTKEEI